MSKNYLSQETEIRLINQIIPYLDSKTFVDIGAEKGSFSLTMLEHGMRGILFEPMIRHHGDLQQLVLRYPETKVYSNAISNVNCKQKFFVATDANNVELDYFHSLQKSDAPGVFTHSKSFEVECRSMQSLSQDDGLFSNIGILKTDTEGNDLNVLRGLGELRPEVIVCEYFTEGLYEGWSEAAPELIIQYMASLGYVKFVATKRADHLEFLGLCTKHYKEKQWGNLIFFRDDMYTKSKDDIEKIFLESENAILEKFKALNTELENKEEVIQQLLAEKLGSHVPSKKFQQHKNDSSVIMESDIVTEASMNASLSALLKNIYKKDSAKSRVAIDVGAHTGAYSKYLANTGYFSKILAFEPKSESFGHLKKSCLISRQTVIAPINLALGNESGTFDLFCDDDSATASLLNYAAAYENKGSVNARAVPVSRLDQYLAEQPIDGELALIKIDTQGNDLSVVSGAVATISHYRPIVQTEFIYIPLYEGQCTPAELEEIFSRLNYVLYSLNNIHVTNFGRIAFCDALFIPNELNVAEYKEFFCIDNQDSLTQQIKILDKICAERLSVIEVLDAEVRRLRTLLPSQEIR